MVIMMREKILSVSIKDCRVDTFRAGGNGGQNQNKRDSGVRLTHEPSGAVAESREERSQLQNKRTALKRLAETPAFKYWVSAVTNNQKTQKEIEADVERELNDPSITKTEVRVSKDTWVEATEKDLK